jgi:hypothetical protein
VKIQSPLISVGHVYTVPRPRSPAREWPAAPVREPPAARHWKSHHAGFSAGRR